MFFINLEVGFTEALLRENAGKKKRVLFTSTITERCNKHKQHCVNVRKLPIYGTFIGMNKQQKLISSY